MTRLSILLDVCTFLGYSFKVVKADIDEYAIGNLTVASYSFSCNLLLVLDNINFIATGKYCHPSF